MKMNKLQVFGLVILGLLFFTATIGLVAATDDDGDGVDDEIEDAEKRDLGVQIEPDKIEIESILSTGSQLNKISFEIRNDSNGVELGIEFEPNYVSDSNTSNIELEFEVRFREIIEYLDENGNGVYDELIDTEVQVVELNSFMATEYKLVNVSVDTQAHYFKISTSDGIFIIHAFFVEEFEIINNTLITPTETKFDIEINNFNFLNDSSRLALYTKLQSEADYEEDEETEDEEDEYAEDEKGVVTIMNNNVGFFTWKENATVDGISTEVITSPVLDDETEVGEQKIYLNYKQGTIIYHDPKIGIALISGTTPMIPGFIPIALLGAAAVGVIVSLIAIKKRK